MHVKKRGGSPLMIDTGKLIPVKHLKRSGGVGARVGFPQAFYPKFPNPPNSIYQHTAQNPHKSLNMFPNIKPLAKIYIKCFKLFILRNNLNHFKQSRNSY